MNEDEVFLDLVQNHHYQGGLADTEGNNFCLLGAAMKAYNLDIVDINKKMTPIIKKNYPDFMKKSQGKIPAMETAYFNDKYGSHEDIMLVAKLFVEAKNDQG